MIQLLLCSVSINVASYLLFSVSHEFCSAKLQKKTSSDIDVILPESRLLITDLITHEILFYLLLKAFPCCASYASKAA